MNFSFSNSYDQIVLKRPALILLLVVFIVVFFGYFSKAFRLDASSDSLVLENDQALHLYRQVRDAYGSDDYLVITYAPKKDLFGDEVLRDLGALRDELLRLKRVSTVFTLLDAPLIKSPPVTLSELRRGMRTLESKKTDRTLARQEFLSSPLYHNLLVSPDGKTTALQVMFHRDKSYYQLLERRNQLRDKHQNKTLSSEERTELSSVTQQFERRNATVQAQTRDDIARVREIMHQHQEKADMHVGGVPMIVADSIDFIQHDIMTFGVGVLFFLIIILSVVFRRARWVVLPMLTCGVTAVIVIGFLGLVQWPVTVVSSNFISLLFILTLSLTVHLIVSYRELHAEHPNAEQYTLVQKMVRKKVWPCFYTTVTTMVAFSSLIFSDIRPIIDFGWMMTAGLATAFFLSFTLFPACLMLMSPGLPAIRRDITGKITAFFATLIHRYGRSVFIAFVLLAVTSLVGLRFLTVENRFIDYFKASTDIYRGMVLIDKKLGGTIPLDVIIDAPADFHKNETQEEPLVDEYGMEIAGGTGITGTSYWFNRKRLKDVDKIHTLLDGLSESGKVLSVSSSMRFLDSLKNADTFDNFFLALLYKRLPKKMKEILFDPYMLESGNQLRFAIRVFETDPALKRKALLEKIKKQLVEKLNLRPSQIHLAGMFVLYNNMLQSLFRSQILTLGVVFIAIFMMFLALFRNIKIAGVAIVPNLFAAMLVLGVMGLMNIPLDLMTITIAAITIGIGVDDTIHYVYRYTEEFAKDKNSWASVKRSHASIGRAMYYTTITIALGFSILVLSNFRPTLYFGALTGFAMVAALLANLTLLPLLIVWLKPLGQAKSLLDRS